MDDSVLEKKIKETLAKKSEDVHADGLAAWRIRTRVNQRIKEETGMKKNRSWKRIVVVTAAICILGTMSAMALGKVKYTSSHSSHNEEVTDFASAKSMQNGYDASVKVIEGFSNGYTFKRAVPAYEQGHDEGHNVVENYTAMHFTYGKEGCKDVSLSATRISSGVAKNPDQILTLADGTELRFTRTLNKFLPPEYEGSYELTEEEKKLEEAGKLNVAYGSSEIETITSEAVTWQQDGISYCLFMMSDEMSGDELLQMAKELSEVK
ncbi:MAG: hypothetical protein HFE84_05685 [Lachnospiraceae bacterium]|nr:hypothetical protein [Lachnospiraceae bacterium]